MDSSRVSIRQEQDMSTTYHQDEIHQSSPFGTLAQLSYAPATTKTVVTTTTTTTTSFPPFLMTAPHKLRARDTEKYPLAASPTPPSLKRFPVKLEAGQLAYFEEAERPDVTMREFHKTQDELRANNGFIQSTISTEDNDNSATSATSYQHSSRGIDVSIPVSEASSSRSAKRRRSNSPNPMKKSILSRLHPLRRDYSLDSSSDTEGYEEDFESFESASHVHIPTPAESLPLPMPLPRPRSGTELRRPGPSDFRRPSLQHTQRARHVQGSATPPLAESDLEAAEALDAQLSTRRPFIPGSINTSPVQDASLPSPSLSPITAAANLSRSVPALLAHVTEPSRDQSRAGSKENLLRLDPAILQDAQAAYTAEHSQNNPQLPTPSVTDIPGMLDSFDALPDNLKSYMMYQFLRRCTKDTLQFVSEIISPALKCDFLARLPTELSQLIIKNLDSQSMCRAAQVSRKWRDLINTDERAWMELLATDGFKVAQSEMQRAIREGWGWQFANGDSEREDETMGSSSMSMIKAAKATPSLRKEESLKENDELSLSSKRKRKLTHKSTIHKKVKKSHSSRTHEQYPSWIGTLGKARGPSAYATAAAALVPRIPIGLPSLQHLHLFKSIYQRHHQIRRSWMNPETKPLHLAFRARQRNVVTCLQFDSDKVLTGSDDANIDIYDTRTGASLKQLEGHEGGVWALEYYGNILVSGSTDRSVRVWNMEEGKCLQVFHGHTSTVRCLQILQPTKVGEDSHGRAIMMPKEPLIITGSRDSTCRVWKLPKLTDPPVPMPAPNTEESSNRYFVRTLTGHVHSVRAIAAHADTLVSGSYDSTVRVWRISTGELVHRLQGHTTKVYSVVLDHERARCISGSMDNLVKVWSIETGQCLFTLEGHTSLVGLLDLRDDILVSAAADSTLRIWDPENGRCLNTLSAHTGAITCFSHDGQKVISGSDRTLKMWNTKTGEHVRDLLTDLTGVWQIKFDERRCIAAVQRHEWTYIEVLDFGACRDGIVEEDRGRRIVVDSQGQQVNESAETFGLPVAAAAGAIQDLNATLPGPAIALL